MCSQRGAAHPAWPWGSTAGGREAQMSRRGPRSLPERQHVAGLPRSGVHSMPRISDGRFTWSCSVTSPLNSARPGVRSRKATYKLTTRNREGNLKTLNTFMVILSASLYETTKSKRKGTS